MSSKKTIRWNSEKNKWLKNTRGVSFERVVIELKRENQPNIVDIVEHPNRTKYPNQEIILLNIKNYIWIVPFVEEDSYIFLKTIYKSRKYKKMIDL